MLIKKYEVSVADVVVMNGLCGVNTTFKDHLMILTTLYMEYSPMHQHLECP